MKNVTLPVEILDAAASLCLKWERNPENLPEKYPEINIDIQKLYEIMEKKLEAVQKRDEYQRANRAQ